MTDEYTREVLRDAIPMLEQLLERLKVLAGTFTANKQHLTVDDHPSQECCMLKFTVAAPPPPIDEN